MIDPKELRLWNWVAVNGVPTEIQGIVRDASGSYGYNLFFGSMPDFYSCDPIPLTPEVLVSAGFEHDDPAEEGGYYRINDFQLYYNTSEGQFEYTKPNGMNIVIDYVHQLQNLYFELEQCELEIKLNL